MQICTVLVSCHGVESCDQNFWYFVEAFSLQLVLFNYKYVGFEVFSEVWLPKTSHHSYSIMVGTHVDVWTNHLRTIRRVINNWADYLTAVLFTFCIFIGQLFIANCCPNARVRVSPGHHLFLHIHSLPIFYYFLLFPFLISMHHRTTLSGYIFATKTHIDNWKNLLRSNISPPDVPTIWWTSVYQRLRSVC